MPEFRWLSKLADHIQLSDEILPTQSVVELVGEGRVLVEYHKGVCEYSDMRVSVNTSFGVAEICGCNLKLTVITSSQLVIFGIIESIHLIREG